ncbi:Outer membrane receptor proteins, mostly Fe transport [Tenacibaculum sp. MAR_2009_124]|uniref:TonB-dependent receptor n=1 Tax=Tenacibaculum sp. MAR_2009_124 TaxID=1250059 RepID=UPI00089960B1|nr:TonB-dependent receptor [Tenacibaculum sp. MAR_2009_124]SEB67597.1 Outer membrane receptor proteins, mostly Fe transport [Tenacibaculum sp. MAR_2009_124]
MKNIISTIVLFISVVSFSQNPLKGRILHINDSGIEESVQGASVYWLGTTIGVFTDEKGRFAVPYKKEYKKLVISFVGFRTDTLLINKNDYLKHVLREESVLKEVELSIEKESTRRSFFEAQNVMNVGSAELLKAACCNLSESFETNPSIDVNFSDALTGAKQIQMLGLKSPYLLITQENIPSIRGASQAFGLTFTPGTWVESIQITKGAGSVVNGFESISGQINAELVKPYSDDKLFVNFYGALGGRLELNTHVNQKVSDKWQTGIYIHGNHRGQVFDRNNDGFLDNPLADQINIMNRWQYTDPRKGWVSFVNLRYLNDRKQMGELDFNFKKDRGSSEVWGSEIKTSRFDLSTKLGYVFPELPFQKVSFQLAYSDHNQKSFFGLRDYTINHKSFYGNGLFSSVIGDTRHKFKTGVSFLYDNYSEFVINEEFNRREEGFGVFFEYAYDDNDSFSFTAGLRLDTHNLLGTFLTPRVHIRYTPWAKGVFRTSFGRGIRSANIFAENQQLFASSRTINVQSEGGKVYGLNPEVAWNYGISFLQGYKLFNRKGSVSVDYYQTTFQNKVVVDWEDSNAISFYNLKGESQAQSLQIEVNQNLISYFNIRLAYRLNDVTTDYNSGRLSKPLLARDRFFTSLSYETPLKKSGAKWKFDTTYNWLGGQRLPGNQESLLDRGLDQYSQSYSTLNAQITKVFSGSFEVYVGAENITDVRQKNPILGSDNPFMDNFDTTIVYAPIFGSNYYAGLRFKLN